MDNLNMDIDLKRMAERQVHEEQMKLRRELGDWMLKKERSNQVTLRISADKIKEGEFG